MEAVVIGVDGAAPARLGARMVLDPRGGRLGSLGDDALDVAVANDAMFVEPTSGPVRRSYGLSGGSVEVLLATKEVRPKLVILSATPVALELLVLAKLRGYETLLVEPRPERVTAQYLGAADLVVPSLDEVVIDEHTVAVHTDHGAPDIVQAVATLLRARAGFVAVTGDPGASVLRLDSLRQMGFGDEELSRVRIPSATATERPGDVALAIASQLGPSNGH
jgi:xanthine/CO dehydrogenase XdhC/CoxF family maturation factor